MRGVTSIIFLLSFTVSIHGLRTRIYGGSDAPEAMYPYQVSLRTTYHICGGSIINKRWILTAAHCIRGKDANEIKVVVGTTLRSEGSGTTYQAEKLIDHKGYSSKKYQNDIGLVRVNKDIQFNHKVQPIKLANKGLVDVNNEKVVLSGWGRLTGNIVAEKMQQIVLQVYDLEKCKQRISHPVINTQLCTLTKTNEGFCFGDSGGPLVNKYGIQIGIVSFNRGCAEGNPDVYTRVSSFRDWIDERIGQY